MVYNIRKEDFYMKLVIVRHGESLWNKENLFTGWTDVDLTDKGRAEARLGGKLLKDAGFEFDIAYTSVLKRAVHSLDLILDELDQSWLEVVKDYRLNERHYGALQGLNKSETAKEYGEEQVLIWRRSFDVKPPKLELDDKRAAQNQAGYRKFDKELLPLHESLKETIERVMPYFEGVIKEKMLSGEKVLIVAHGNSIRAMVKSFENLSDAEIMGVNIPTGVPLVYEFDKNFNVLSKEYLGDQEKLAKEMEKVAKQGKAK